MQKHNILGKKADRRAALKEKIISLVAWLFIIFCICIVFYFCKIGLKTLFLTSNSHFTLENISIKAVNLPENSPGMVDIDNLKEHLNLQAGTDNIFEIDLQEVQKKVLENIAVDSAEISYFFPDTINIDVTEKRPVARLQNRNIITPVKTRDGYAAYILPRAGKKFFLPFIRIPQSELLKCTPGHTSKRPYLNLPLKLILFIETYRMRYDKAEAVLGHKDFASMEILKINDVFLDQDRNTLQITLKGDNKLYLSSPTRLRILADDIEMGVRRACIAIIENAIARKQTSIIDARYSSTSTE